MDTGFIIRRILGQASPVHPDRPALSIEMEETWSYAQLREFTNRYSNGLLSLGIHKGDRIGILLYNSLEYVALDLAVTSIGAIAVRINFRLTPEELKFVIQDSGCKVLCFHSAFADRIYSIRDQLSVHSYVVLDYMDVPSPEWAQSWDILDKADASIPKIPRPSLHDDAMIMYTSGTTGKPKGAVWTQSNLLWNSSMQIMQWCLNSSSIVMTTGPLYHIGALEDLVLPALFAGGHAVIMRSGGFTIERVLRTIEKHKVQYALLYPFMVYDLLREPTLDQYQLDHLRLIISGGDPVMPWAIEVLRERLPQTRLQQVYGLTEGTAIVTYMDPDVSHLYPQCVGKPGPFTEIRVVNDQGNDVKIGEVGEVWVRSPGVAKEYWRNPEATASTFVDGWCKTGDLGRIHSEGYLELTGRKKDMIRTGGENVYPAEVEAVLTKHPDIQDVAVIGVPDPKYLEAVCAVIVSKTGKTLSRDGIIEYAHKFLAGYKCPKHVVFVDQLPRTPSGKVQKAILREQYKGLGSPPPEGIHERKG